MTGMVYARSDSGREESDARTVEVEMGDRPGLDENWRGREGVRLCLNARTGGVMLKAEVNAAERR